MMLFWALVATVVLPFLLGLWVGSGKFAAFAFAALGVTLLIRQLQLSDEAGDATLPLMLWIVVAATLSAASAYAGGVVRERRRRDPG
jgi:hypothetical protein